MKPPRYSMLYLYICLAAFLFSLGVIGFARHAAMHNLPLTPLDWVYLTLQLIPLNSGAIEPPVPFELELARFFIPLLAASAAVQAILKIFREQIHMWKLPRLRGHIIICGLSRKGFLLARQFHRRGKDVVVIERDEENDWIESCRGQGMFVLQGDASDSSLLKTAGVLHAEGLIAVCDNDGINAEIALRAQQLTQNRTANALTCLLHVSDPQLCGLLREQEIGLEQAPFRLELFNVFEQAARGMLQEHPAWNDELLQPEKPPHILIVGLGRMGENLALNLARKWWNLQIASKERLRITIVDRSANSKAESLCIRYPQMNKACDLIPVQMEVHSPEFERADFLFGPQNQPVPTAIYICLDDDALGLHAGLTLGHRISDLNIPIVIRMSEESGLARLVEFRRNHHQAYRKLFAFGYLDHTCTPDLLKITPRDQLARLAHEEYVRMQLKSGGTPADAASMKPWDQLEGAYRKANYQWADHIPILLKQNGYDLAPLSDWDAPSFQFILEQSESMARSEHELWCQDRRADGWVNVSDDKNLKSKNNPNLVAWEELSDEERDKNRLLVRHIPAFLGQAGFQVAKIEN